MMTKSKLILKLQYIITRFQMWRAAFLLRQDYKAIPMQEFTALDSDEFFEYS